MIIPMRCFECGKAIADKWRGYQKALKKLKGDTAEQRVYFDGTKIPETPEKKVLDMLKINTCCRTHFLTQVDLIDKI
jgi:DNA-directed RNA polymerase subunit N (RpoN/RPB10)